MGLPHHGLGTQDAAHHLVTPSQFRAQFPALDQIVHLASCSLAPASTALAGAFARMLDAMKQDPTPWDMWLGEVEESRSRFARLIGAATEEIAVVPSATVGAYQVASTFDWRRRPGIVSTDVEYSSVAHVWLGQRARGAKVFWAHERDGQVDAEEYVRAIDERTALVSIPILSYRNGARMPVAEVVRRAREVGARVFVDAYQSTGVLPLDVGLLDCDYAVSGAMKYLLGLPGVAYLYARTGVTDDTPPPLTGWYGRKNPLAFDPTTLDYPGNAARFQVNMPSLPVALAANAGLGLLGTLDLETVECHVEKLTERAIHLLEEAGVRLCSPTAPGVRGPQVAIAHQDPMGLAASMNAQGIFPARGNVVRLSFHYFNDEEDVDRACKAITVFPHRAATT